MTPILTAIIFIVAILTIVFVAGINLHRLLKAPGSSKIMWACLLTLKRNRNT